MATILAVDDSATMRKCLEITFKGTDIELVLCESAAEALERVKILAPDLVIADLSLSPCDGYELCEALKLAVPELPVLLLSSKQNPFDSDRGQEADDHMDKPFDTQRLFDKAQELIEQGALEDDGAFDPLEPADDSRRTVPFPDRNYSPLASTMVGVGHEKPAPEAEPSEPDSLPEPPMREAVPPPRARLGTLHGTGDDDEALTGHAHVAPVMATSPSELAPSTSNYTPAAAPNFERGDELAAAGAAPVAEVSEAPAGANGAQDFAAQLADLGLEPQQIAGVLALSREVV